MEGGAPALYLFENIRRFGGPDERLGRVVMMCDVVGDRILELRDVMKAAAPELLGREIAEESLNHIEPRCARWREVDDEPRMLGEPGLHRGVLMRGVVILNQMNRFVLGRAPVNQPQKAQPFFMRVPLHAFSDYASAERVECSEERRD